VHISFCKPITKAELQECDTYEKNDKFRRLAEIIDERIIDGYKIWPTNEIAASVVTGEEFPDSDVKGWFIDYLSRRMKEISGVQDPGAVRDNLIRIYANPALRKKGVQV